MATNDNLPNIVSTLADRNLDTSRLVDLGDSVLVIGTASRGPVNQPIRVYNPQDAINIFGPIEQGTAVRGLAEVYYGPNGVKDIRICRISNGKKAKLDFLEQLGSDEENESYESGPLSDQVVALSIEALYPGDIYNSVSFRQNIVNGKLSVIGYNPITGLETNIIYDPTGTSIGSVTNVVELQDAINADPNLNTVVVATANELTTAYELFIDSSNVAPSGTFARDLNGTLIVDLGLALQQADTNHDGWTDDTSLVTPSGVPVTAGNRLIRLNEVFEKANVNVELNSAGYNQIALPYPVQTSGGVSLPFLNLDLTPDIGGAGEARHRVVNAYIGTGDASETTFQFTAYEAIDTSTFHLYRTSSVGTTVEIPASSYTVTQVGGPLFSQIAEISLAAAPDVNQILTVTYYSQIFDLTQASSMAAVRASNSYRTYFAAGDKVTFGTAQPNDIEVAYAAKKIYNQDSDITIYDAKEGEVHFTNAQMQPDYATGVWVGFNYDYMPEWINIGTGAQSLQGGTNGISMNNATKYALLEDCYEAIADYSVDCIVVMNTYIDDTKVVYDEETGLPVTVNAGFAQQFQNFLTSLQDGVNEAYGIMAVKGSSGTTLADLNEWYEKLNTTSTADPTRAANIMAALDCKNLSVVAFEPVVAYNEMTIPYVTTGEAVYAGLVCKLAITSASTFKNIGPQVLTCKHKLSSRQLDALTVKKYVTARLTPEGAWVITEDRLASGTGSDYIRLSTFRIVSASMDVVRSAGRPFLGELFSPVKKAALETAISKGLMDLQEQGAIRKFDFRIEQTAQERVLGIARIPLVIWPEFELVRIEVEVKLSNA